MRDRRTIRLRTKLLLGFGGLLTLLTVVSCLSIVTITWYTQAIERIMRENYDSVVYGERMIEALNQIMQQVHDVLFAGVARDGAFTSRLTAAQRLFDENLDKERGNITLPGEGELEHDLRLNWRTFQTSLQQTLTVPAAPQPYQRLVKQSEEVRSRAQRVIDMNVENMVSVNGQAKAWANRTRMALWVLLGSGLLIGVVFIAFAGRWILQPLRSLTGSIKQIEAGDLNLVLSPRSRDEVGELTEAFNAMTARLREFRRTDEAKLLLTQQTTQLAIDSLPDAVAVARPDGIIEIANDAARDLFNLSPGRGIGESGHRRVGELFSAVRDDQQSHEAHSYNEALQIFESPDREGGGERFFLPHGTPIKDKTGQLAGVTIVLVDVTQLRRLDELKSSLIATVSHELRTPLTSIRLAHHLLLSDRIGALNEKQTEVAMEARDNADRLQRIIDDLLDMSRIESGKSGLDFAPVRPHELVADAADGVRSAAQEKNVDLVTDVPVELPEVRADATRMRHVLVNLLSNAVRYTPPGGQIRIEATLGENGVRFSVSDTGSGIPREYQSRVFERFFRVPGQDGPGIGLGLAIAREIVQAHGGTLSMESQEGVGTTFYLTLPLCEALMECEPSKG